MAALRLGVRYGFTLLKIPSPSAAFSWSRGGDAVAAGRIHALAGAATKIAASGGLINNQQETNMRARLNVLVLSLACVLTLGGCKALLTEQGKDAKADLRLAASNQTEYVIVKPDAASDVDAYAVATLTNFLFQKTGAVFPVVLPGQVAPANKRIFVGLSAPALKTLGSDPLAALKDQEYAARSAGSDIFLYGKGIHGNFHAAVDFLETEMGVRWYTWRRGPIVPPEKTVTLRPFARQKGFAFKFRGHISFYWSPGFYYWHGANALLEFDRPRFEGNKIKFPDGIVDFMRREPAPHTLFFYIPYGQKPRYAFPWVAETNYFTSHPDFFAMDANGKRAPGRLQLCFGNPELRKELTRNVYLHIKHAGESCVISVEAEDNPGKFCFCPACQELEKKYRSPGGPLFDYLIELCNQLKTDHPQIMISTLAYRRDQSQVPPALPEGQRLPDNLIVVFCPVSDSILGDWTRSEPMFTNTYADLLQWNRISSNVIGAGYVNGYGSEVLLPFGNVERLVNIIRFYKKAGCIGFMPEHDSEETEEGNNFSELQSYLMYKLERDVNCDTEALTREFTDHQYGAAGPLVRKYLKDLEEGRKNIPFSVFPISTSLAIEALSQLPYLTPENIHRWQTWFDRMEQDTAGNPEQQENVLMLRRSLDIATLRLWFKLAKAYPAYFKDYNIHLGRIEDIQKKRNPPPWYHKLAMLDDLVIVLRAGNQEKPLPPEFANFNKDLIRQYKPGGGGMVADPDAAFGYAITVDQPNMPFTFGFCPMETKVKEWGPRCSLASGDIKPGAYQLFKLGTITVTANCIVYFGISWMTNCQLGQRLYEPGAENQWDAWVSLKFDGPLYGGKAKNTVAMCDRIIFVKKLK